MCLIFEGSVQNLCHTNQKSDWPKLIKGQNCILVWIPDLTWNSNFEWALTHMSHSYSDILVVNINQRKPRTFSLDGLTPLPQIRVKLKFDRLENFNRISHQQLFWLSKTENANILHSTIILVWIFGKYDVIFSLKTFENSHFSYT